MIVIAILGILADAALPADRDYTVRGRVTEGLKSLLPKFLITDNASIELLDVASGLASEFCTDALNTIPEAVYNAAGTCIQNVGNANDTGVIFSSVNTLCITTVTDVTRINFTTRIDINYFTCPSSLNVSLTVEAPSPQGQIIWHCFATTKATQGAIANPGATLFGKYAPASCRCMNIPHPKNSTRV